MAEIRETLLKAPDLVQYYSPPTGILHFRALRCRRVVGRRFIVCLTN